jgi:hypothetical protein
MAFTARHDKNLAVYMTKAQMNEIIPGQKTKHSIPDMMIKGLEVELKMVNKSKDAAINADGEGSDKGQEDQVEDLEIEDDWDLELL